MSAVRTSTAAGGTGTSQKLGQPCVGGEIIVAFVVPREAALSARALSAHLAERLTRYKLPGEIRVVAALPKTTVGKVDKTVLRATARETGAPTR